MTINTTTHTPTPWTVDDWNQKDGEIHIWASGTPRIAELPLRYVSINEQKANAAHIVRCVNEREELLEALRSCIAMIRAELHDEKPRENIVYEYERVSEVLARAEREEG